jgi:large subunit ribosomal protein L6
MITIPENVTIELSENKVTVKGPNGQVEKTFTPVVSLSLSGKELSIKGGKSFVNTVESLINSMVIGVTDGFKKELKVVYAHFPVSIEVKGKEISIKNFQGEKKPRSAQLVGDTKVVAKGQQLTITGPDKQAVGQTAANLIGATRIKDKDDRIFQDGVYELLQ